MTARVFNRYDNLVQALDRIQARGQSHVTYLEVGTYDGRRALALARTWWRRSPEHSFNYHGFDLFEALTEERSRAEFSKAQRPPSRAAVSQSLTAAGLAHDLYPGDTRETLAAALPAILAANPPDLIFLDGGHSLETVASDWAALQPALGPETICLLDDYYVDRVDVGCKTLADSLDPAAYAVRLLDPLDVIDGSGLRIRMVEVARR